MNEKEFMKELEKLYKHYDYVKKQAGQYPGDYHLAVLKERNEAISRLVEYRNRENNKANYREDLDYWYLHER